MFSLFKKQKSNLLTKEQLDRIADYWENDKMEYRTIITKKLPELSEALGVQIAITIGNIDFDLSKKSK